MNKRKVMCNFLLTFSLLALATNAMATSIPIANASFEAPALSLGNFTSGTITGWTATGTTGVFHPTSAELPPPSDGLQVGYTNAGSASQVLAAALTAGTQYTLAVDFTSRKDCCSWIGAEIDFMAGATVLASNQLASLAPGGAQTLIATYDALASNPLLGQALQVRILNTSNPNGGQIDFDNVRLDAVQVTSGVPEPGTLLLVGGGILAALGFKRRRT